MRWFFRVYISQARRIRVWIRDISNGLCNYLRPKPKRNNTWLAQQKSTMGKPGYVALRARINGVLI